MKQIKNPPRLAPGTGLNNYSCTANSTTAATIAHALDAKQTGSGKWRAKCPAHDDHDPSFAISEGERGPLFYCFSGCTQDEVISALRSRGLWQQSKTRKPPTRPDQAAKLWEVALRHLTHGEPLQWPPHTKALPKTGQVWIVCGPSAWAAARSLQEHRRHALVWPHAERGYIPCIAYRWPVAGRDVVVMDTAPDSLAPNVAWANSVQDFGRMLVARWHASSVQAFGDFEPVTYRAEVRHAA